MKAMDVLWQAARRPGKGALPILSFPAVQKMGVTVEELVRSSALQAESMATVARETPTLAAVSLMDLSVEAEAFGARVRYARDEVPTVVGQLLPDSRAVEALRVPMVGEGRSGVCVEAIRLARRAIPDKPVLAGIIGPFSLAGRLLDVTEIMYLCYDEPEMVHSVLARAAEFLISYAQALKAAGAHGLIMAEPLAGLLSPQLSGEFSCGYARQITAAVQEEDFAVIYHNCGGAVNRMLPEILSVGASAYHFGNAMDMQAILKAMPGDALCLGNVDPAGCFAQGTPQGVTEATLALLEACGGYVNFLPSSGCDIPPAARWENIRAFFDAVEAWGAAR